MYTDVELKLPSEPEWVQLLSELMARDRASYNSAVGRKTTHSRITGWTDNPNFSVLRGSPTVFTCLKNYLSLGKYIRAIWKTN
jgi:hypothetical protein